MSVDLFALRGRIADALRVLRDDQLGIEERVAQVEQLLIEALAGPGELSDEEAARWLTRPGVAAALARVSREGGNGIYFEANEDGSPSDRAMRVP